MSMTLYHGEPNGPSFTVLAALFEKELDAKRVLIQLRPASAMSWSSRSNPKSR